MDSSDKKTDASASVFVFIKYQIGNLPDSIRPNTTCKVILPSSSSTYGLYGLKLAECRDW
jgi:hypothetical protein